jgi:hypothetical protein
VKLRGIFSLALAFVLCLAAQIAPARADTYAAIAYSVQNGAYAWSVDMDNAADANSSALSSCKKRGDGCVVVISFSNACAALAVGTDRIWAASQALNSQQAQIDALNTCRTKGGTRCDIRVGFCANPPTLNAQPGLWKLSNQSVTGGKIQPASTSTRCITPQDIPAHKWMFLLDTAASDTTCTRTVFNATSNTIDWRFACSGQAPRTTEGSIRFDTPEHYTGTVSTKGTEANANLALGAVIHTDGKWVGACSGATN